jgi:hypothetical protein
MTPEGRGSREGFEGGGSAEDFFRRLAAHWKQQYAGWTAYVLSPDMKLPQALRLKESQRTPMWNGPIECRLFRFDLVAGSARGPRSAGSDAPGNAPADGRNGGAARPAATRSTAPWARCGGRGWSQPSSGALPRRGCGCGRWRQPRLDLPVR